MKPIFKNLFCTGLAAWGCLSAGSPAWADPVPSPEDIKLPGFNRQRPSAVTYTIKNYSVSGNTSVSARSAAVVKDVLPNGLVCLNAEEPGSDMVVIDWLVRCGVSQEGSNLQGYNGLILQILNNRISEDSGDDVTEITGSMVDDGPSQDFSRLSITASPANAMFMLRRLCRAAAQDSFTEEEVERARQDTLNRMGDSGGTNGELYSIFLSCFYQLHPYKRTPQAVPVILKRATAADITDYYRKNFTPDRTVITAAGKINGRTVFETVREHLSKARPAAEKIMEVQWEPHASEREVYLYSSSELAWVLLGYQAPPLLSSDYAAMKVVYGVLGAGLSSRLWMELREKRGLAYEVGARYPELLGPSHLLCNVVTKPTSAGVARRRMLAEVKRLREEGITQNELDEAKEKLLGMYLLERESLSGRALHLGMAELSGLGFNADALFVQELQRVTTDDVKRAAERYLIEPTLIVARPGGRLYFDW